MALQEYIGQYMTHVFCLLKGLDFAHISAAGSLVGHLQGNLQMPKSRNLHLLLEKH